MGKKLRRPVHPGEVLREDVVKPLGLTVGEFAAAVGKSPSAVGLVLREKRPVTVDLANRLARALGTSPELWLRLQNAVDIYESARKHGRAYRSIRRLPRAPRVRSPAGA
jgi:antitoxin HigA-1